LRLFSFGGYGLALVVFGAYDSYPAYCSMSSGRAAFSGLRAAFAGARAERLQLQVAHNAIHSPVSRGSRGQRHGVDVGGAGVAEERAQLRGVLFAGQLLVHAPDGPQERGQAPRRHHVSLEPNDLVNLSSAAFVKKIPRVLRTCQGIGDESL